MGWGERISIREDSWLPKSAGYRLNTTVINDDIRLVSDIIDD